jgi:hypothetical protein
VVERHRHNSTFVQIFLKSYQFAVASAHQSTRLGFLSRSIRYGARLSDKPTISTPLVRRCFKFPVIRRAHGLALLAVPVANERVVVKFVCQNFGSPLFHVGVVTRTAVILLAGVLMRLHCAPVLNGPCALYRDNRAVSH